MRFASSSRRRLLQPQRKSFNLCGESSRMTGWGCRFGRAILLIDLPACSGRMIQVCCVRRQPIFYPSGQTGMILRRSLRRDLHGWNHSGMRCPLVVFPMRTRSRWPAGRRWRCQVRLRCRGGRWGCLRRGRLRVAGCAVRRRSREAAVGKGGDGGIPINGGHGVPPLVPCSMNLLMKSSRCRNVPLPMSSAMPASRGVQSGGAVPEGR